MIQKTRIRRRDDQPVAAGRYVLYWMQRAQRADWNHALEYAIHHGNRLGLPVVVCFGLMDDYPEANERHYAFMLEGLAATADALAARGIAFVVRHGPPPAAPAALGGDAALLVMDRGYFRHEKAWRAAAQQAVSCPVVEVETDVVVPVLTASERPEIGARTLRPRIHRVLEEYLQELRPAQPERSSLELGLAGDIEPRDVDGTLARLRLDRSVGRVRRFRGGRAAATERLASFLDGKFPRYAAERSEPGISVTSEMSPYLHFGQVSPLEIALAVQARGGASAASYLEELIVRRELAFNLVEHNPDYDRYDGLPRWARQSLAAHAEDPRPALYDEATLARAGTADPYWNAAQREMAATGYMHNYMRMYWGKKILEWRPTPEDAFATAMRLNNRYLLDGRDPNSCAGVAWCFGLHDRPWIERAVFGTVRYMNDKGLLRKFDMKAYLERVDRLAAPAGA